MNSGCIQRDAKDVGIYLALFTGPEGDSCCSTLYLPHHLDKNVTICKLKTSLSRNFAYNLQLAFRGLCQVPFYDFVANYALK